MKIALLHFDLANGSKEPNKKKLLQGVKEASAHAVSGVTIQSAPWAEASLTPCSNFFLFGSFEPLAKSK